MTHTSTSTIQEFLAGIYPFEQLSSVALAKLATQCQLLRYRIGQAIVVREKMPSHVVILYEGQARLLGYDPRAETPVTLKLLQPGEILGWIGLVRGVPCETAIASGETICLVLSAEDFLAFLEQEPLLANAFRSQCTLVEVFDLLGAELARQANSNVNLKGLALQAQSEAVICNLLPGTVPLNQLDHERFWFVSGGGTVVDFPVSSCLNLENASTYIDVTGSAPARLVGFPKLSELLSTPIIDLLKNDDPFLAEVLQKTQDSNGDPQVVYPLLQANLDKLDDNLAQQLRSWATNTLPKLVPSQAQATAKNIANFSNLIRQFSLGNKDCNIEIAITGYKIFAQVFTREDFPEQWAMFCNNLGRAYLERIRGERAENLDQAIASYTAALEVYTREAFPTDWAMTQNNLGNAYVNRILGDKAQNLEQAIASYTAALQVYTRDAFPQDWATTQINLGIAYSNRILGDKAQNLEQAIARFQAALQVYTREAFPYEWATVCGNLGNAYSEKIVDRIANIEIAILFYEDALAVYSSEQFFDELAFIREKLSNAHYLLEYYQRELELVSLPSPIGRDEALARIELTQLDLLELAADA